MVNSFSLANRVTAKPSLAVGGGVKNCMSNRCLNLTIQLMIEVRREIKFNEKKSLRQSVDETTRDLSAFVKCRESLE